ncbi:arsenite methyltransferase-like [Glandiceps talaboti]
MAMESSNCEETVIRNVQDYYGKRITSTEDFKTSATCPRPTTKTTPSICKAMTEIHADVTAKNYGCGLCIPSCLEGCSILDLGSGAGRDCFIASKLVGPNGNITGIDITEEQITFSNKYKEYHREKFGHEESNIDFVLGKMEKLKDAGISDSRYDIYIVSNCAICLSFDKPAVLREAYRVLKPGGELYFSDMYADRPLPDEIRNSEDEVLWGEGLSGALYWKDLAVIAKEVGFSPPRLVTSAVVKVNEELRKIVGETQYASGTYRLFKLPEKMTTGSSVVYKGTILDNSESLVIDANNSFKKDEVVAVTTEMATILRSSRYSQHFEFDVDTAPAKTKDTPNNPNPFDFTVTNS